MAQHPEKAVGIVELGCDETLLYCDFSVAHWRRIRTNNPFERLNREIRHRVRVVQMVSSDVDGCPPAIYGRANVGHATVYEHEPREVCLKSAF